MQVALPEPKTVAELRERYSNVRRRLGLDVMRFQLPAPKRLPAGLSINQIEHERISDIACCYAIRVKAEPMVAKVALIVKLVARAFDVAEEDLTGKTRKADVVHVRHLAIGLALRLTGKGKTEIGRVFGGRDRTTVLYARGMSQRLLDAALAPHGEPEHG